MMLARWTIHARFGHKPQVIDALRQWLDEIGPQAGLDAARSRLLTGSVGIAEAAVQSEHIVQDLAELQRAWDALGGIAAHQAWGRDLEPYVVSGSSRWEILRLV
jgi:hypothetical protein